MLRKKADASESIIFIIMLFFLAISLIIVGFVNLKIKTVVQTTPLNLTTASTDIISGLDYVSTTGIDRAFALMFVGLIIGTMLSSFLIRVHPAFIFVYVLLIGISAFLAVLLTNAYDKFLDNAILNNVAVNFTMMNFIMQHSIKIVIGVFVLSMVILFAKPPEENRI